MPARLGIVRLPNAERVIVDIVKLRDYRLNPDHPRGKHKARVFRRTLDLTQEDAAWLRAQLSTAALQDEAIEGEQDIDDQNQITPCFTPFFRPS